MALVSAKSARLGRVSTSSPAKSLRSSRRTSSSTSSTRSRARGGAVVTRAEAEFIGSPTNLIMIASTGLCLLAGRFGLAPSTRQQVLEPGLKLEEVTNDMRTGDPAGFTAVDVLALGSFGHAIGIGIVLGLKGTGKI